MNFNSPKSNVVILTYHRISNKCDDWSLNPLPIKAFKKHLKFLTKSYNIISLDNLVELMVNQDPISEKTAIITFDDGYKIIIQTRIPYLKNMISLQLFF